MSISEETAKSLTNSIDQLKEALLATVNRTDLLESTIHNCNVNLNPIDKSYIEFAKAFSIAVVGALNSLNVFGTTIAFMTTNGRLVKDSHHAAVIRMVFLCLTIVCLPYTLYTAGFAHATIHRPEWINNLSLMITLEWIYMSTSSALFGYYLTDESNVWVVGPVALVMVVSGLVASAVAFKRPSLLPRKLQGVGWCAK